MTVYEFMEKIGDYEKFYISVAGNDITNDEAVTLHDIKMHYEERPQVIAALEKELVNVDAFEWVLDCELTTYWQNKLNMLWGEKMDKEYDCRKISSIKIKYENKKCVVFEIDGEEIGHRTTRAELKFNGTTPIL